MTLLDLNKVNSNTLEDLKQGNISVLNGLDANTKIMYGLALQNEFGIPDQQKSYFEAAGLALQERLKQQRESEENRQRMRTEHIERESKEWARKMSVARSTYY